MKPSTRRLISFAAALIMMLAALVVFFSFIQPAYSDSQNLKAQIISKKNSLQNEQNAAAQIQSLLEQYRGEQSPQSAVSMALPLTDDQAEVIHQLQTLAAASQLGVQSLAMSHPGARPVARQSLVKPVGVSSAQVRVAGTYGNFKSFLRAIETNIRLTDVQSMVITPVGQQSQDFYTFDLTLATYYQEQ